MSGGTASLILWLIGSSVVIGSLWLRWELKHAPVGEQVPYRGLVITNSIPATPPLGADGGDQTTSETFARSGRNLVATDVSPFHAPEVSEQ